MKSLRYDDVDDLMTLEVFLKLSERCDGCVIPGKKMQDRVKRKQFRQMVLAGLFDGNVDAASRKFDVSRRTIYGWLTEVRSASKKSINPNKLRKGYDHAN